MTKERKIEIAAYAARKGIDYETLYYCDEMYNEDKSFMDDIWEYVTECKDYGSVAFRDKYGVNV